MSRRDLVLKIAIKLFASKGFEGTSVRMIADKAKISVAGMFHHFPSKEDILFEIMIGIMEEVFKKLNDIYESDIPSLKKLEKVCEFYVKDYAAGKHQLIILNT